MEGLIIAIDGYSACGKSTLAKALALKLGLSYVDTGAMYRAVTLYFLQNDISIDSSSAIKKRLDEIKIRFKIVAGINSCFLNGKNVESEIRSQQVSNSVSEVAAISSVRKKLVILQRLMGKKGDLVMDGRDIGSVVFPNANHKFFVIADPEIRAQRRKMEYDQIGMKVSIEHVRENLRKRDHIDSTRADSPLKISANSIVIDNSFLSKKEQLELILKIIKIKKAK